MNSSIAVIDKYVRGINLIKSNSSGYFMFNAHGDVTVLVPTSGGTPSKVYSYDAFGVEVNKSDSDANPWRYCGEYYDKETDTIYLRARYYNPRTGRFLSQDEWKRQKTDDPLSLNLYVYCFNNPIMFVDPSGNIAIYSELSDFTANMFSVNWISLLRARDISKWALNNALEYAKEKEYYYSDGSLCTWNNEADAYRHFIWNAKMTKHLGLKDSITIANNHEIESWEMELIGGEAYYKVPFDSLMDLNNNEMGRKYSQKYKKMSYDDQFQKALKNGDIITSVDQVQDKYGFNDNQVFSDSSGNQYVYISASTDLNNGVSNLNALTKEEYENKKKKGVK